MKNNLFIFGDSFSTTMMRSTKELINLYKGDIKPRHWFQIISNKLDLKLSMYGIGGCCNEEIINNFFFNFYQLNENDVVIISDTAITRIMGFDETDKKITTLNNDCYFYKIDNKSNQYYKDHYDKYNEPNDERNLVDYIYENIVNYEEYWIEYYCKIYENIIKLCKEKGAECYFWTSNYWQSFTSLTVETNSVISDSHWGPIGNKNFATYMLHRIENKDYFNTIKPWDINDKYEQLPPRLI